MDFALEEAHGAMRAVIRWPIRDAKVSATNLPGSRMAGPCMGNRAARAGQKSVAGMAMVTTPSPASTGGPVMP